MQSPASLKKNIPFFAILAFCFTCLTVCKAQQPYKFDNKLYKAVYLNQAVQLMNENKDFVLIDVRTPGEYADTSGYTRLNMGHLKGAINISIDSIPKHLDELKKYSDKNIFLYCSHSQRSRRVSKLLAENGFKNVYNINGGMSVVNETPQSDFALKNTIFVSATPYKNVAAGDALALIQNPATVIIDVRDADEYENKSAAISNNLGHLVNAINIPAAGIKTKFESLHVPKDKAVLVYDRHGGESVEACAQLAKMGYTHVYNLFEGLSAFMCDNHLQPAQINSVIANPPAYKVISIRQCIDMLGKPNNYTIIDARPADEYNNKATMDYLNCGRLNNAVNVPSLEALDAAVSNTGKDAPIVLYGSTSSNLDADVCKALLDKGYKNIYYLYDGIGRFAWASFNIESCKDGINLLTNHEGLY